MYLEFYGLSGFPFQLTPDPRFFFESSVHRKAMAHLVFGLEQNEGFIVITGEVGAGKTTILSRLLSILDPEAFVAAKIVSTHLQGDDMLRAVAAAFGLPFQGMDKATLLRRIEDFLVANHRRGLRALLLVDEAQNVTPQALEELRMLSNFQVGSKVPLQSFLLAQPQFRNILGSPDLEQFRQRIIASYHLGPMNAEETKEYILYRLNMVGWKQDPKITEEAFADIFLNTGGIPRKINTFCNRLMLFAFLDEMHSIDRGAVSAVAEDLGRELNQVQRSLGSDSAGVMHPSPMEPAPLGGEFGDITHRLTQVERQVERHNRALHSLASFIEASSFRGEN